MALDPRSKLQPNCPTPAGNQQRKTEFFRTLGNVGDLEVLNNANNEIGQGLRTLETISNQIRLGEGAPNVFRDENTSQQAGEDAVLNQVGIDSNKARNDGTRFNPAVANRALGQANAIYERVRQGNFEVRDVPEAIQDFGNLKQLIQGIFTPKSNESDKRKICFPSPYATDLIALAPKHKFMFVVEFVFNERFSSLFSQLEFAFVIKRSTRPQIQFEYEDINYYNFRTKVLKRSEYQPMTMTFYDDMKDNSLKFYNNYLQSISPISNFFAPGGKALYEEFGMSFRDAFHSASVTAVDDTLKTIIDHCYLYHITEGGKYIDSYRFDNPRIQNMQLDDLDMTDGSTGTEVSIEFNYDALLIEPYRAIDEFIPTLTDITDAGLYPISPRFEEG